MGFVGFCTLNSFYEALSTQFYDRTMHIRRMYSNSGATYERGSEASWAIRESAIYRQNEISMWEARLLWELGPRALNSTDATRLVLTRRV